MIAGTPVSQQGVSLDAIRISNFNDIKFKVEDYYAKNGDIPQSLDQLTLTPEQTKTLLEDPETKTLYSYNPTSKTSFELCTTFSTDSLQTDDYRYQYPETNNSHNKGYDCIQYSLSSYLLTPTPILVPTK